MTECYNKNNKESVMYLESLTFSLNNNSNSQEKNVGFLEKKGKNKNENKCQPITITTRKQW